MFRLSSFWFLLSFFLFLTSCTSQTPQGSLQTSFYVYRFNPAALIEFSSDFQPAKEIPFSIPPGCGFLNMFSAPMGKNIAIELNCPNGPTVLFLDTGTGTTIQPISASDSHFLAWAPDGKAAYLKVDSLGKARIARAYTSGGNDFIPLTEFTYDLAVHPKNGDFTFTFSRGLGQGSELWLATKGGNVVEQLYADPLNYISFARYSPDGRQIAFIKIPDTQTPFQVGELWITNSDHSNAHKLADVDAGHGYAANWSPDGKRIAFVVRENPEDKQADQSSEALISNIYVLELQSGALQRVTHLERGWAETPFWSPDGNTLAFNVVLNDRMEVQLADLATGDIRSLITEATCCPVWIRK
jgi:dipeptidyl aminopeptidase/acylaminoacyl peptidase